MNDKERANGDDFWEKNLEGIDMGGIYPEGSLLSRLYDESHGTPEQRAVYQQVREVLKPYERYLNSQAEVFLSTPLPQGVKKHPFKHAYSFSIRSDSDKITPVQIEAQRVNNTWYCKSFKANNHEISMNNGIITKIKVCIGNPSDENYLLFAVHRPDQMGLQVSSSTKAPVQKDGSFRPTGENYSFPEIVSRFTKKVLPIGIDK